MATGKEILPQAINVVEDNSDAAWALWHDSMFPQNNRHPGHTHAAGYAPSLGTPAEVADFVDTFILVTKNSG